MTGCDDGIIRVWDFEQNDVIPKKVLTGHSGPIFNLALSPLETFKLASSSDDCTIRVWNLMENSNNSGLVLAGHLEKARAIVWNTEVSWILLSGSWDATIRVWDTNNGTCIHICNSHYGDIYGLSCHPKRPFLYISASRDTTIRFWNLEMIAEPILF